MLETTTVAVPDRGHIVSVRQRGYVATGVQACNLPHPCWRSTLDSQHTPPVATTALHSAIKPFLMVTWQRGYQDSLSELPALLDNRRFATGGERQAVDKQYRALPARLKQIPAEIEAKQQAICARYADPKPGLVPVAIAF